MTYETLLATVHSEDRDYVDRTWTAALRGEPYDIEHRIVVDDRVKWVRERAELEFDRQGQLLGGFGTTHDITERQRAEEALVEFEERLRQAAQAGRMFAFEWDPETDAVKRSPEAGLILGLSGDAAIHDNGKDFFGKIYPAGFAPPLSKNCMTSIRGQIDTLLTIELSERTTVRSSGWKKSPICPIRCPRKDASSVPG